MTRGRDLTAERRILADDRLDDLGEALLALTREIWVLTDRQMVLEAVLAEQGIDISAIDRHQPDEAMEKRLAERRQRLIDTVLCALRVD